MKNKIIHILIILISFSLLILSCEKSNETSSKDENVVSATLFFNGQAPIFLDAKRSSTQFIKSIDASQEDASISIQAGDSLYSLVIVLRNIAESGTYPLSQTLNGKKSVSCQYNDFVSGELYSTCRMPSPGSVTLEVIANDFIAGTFNAELTNSYPGSKGTIKNISVTNGYFRGKLVTEIR